MVISSHPVLSHAQWVRQRQWKDILCHISGEMALLHITFSVRHTCGEKLGSHSQGRHHISLLELRPLSQLKIGQLTGPSQKTKCSGVNFPEEAEHVCSKKSPSGKSGKIYINPLVCGSEDSGFCLETENYLRICNFRLPCR